MRRLSATASDSGIKLREELEQRFRDCGLVRPFRRARYEPGHRLELGVTGVLPANDGRMVVEIDRFVGGGFAGQVYRVKLLVLEEDADDKEAIDDAFRLIHSIKGSAGMMGLESIALLTAEDALEPFELVSWRRGLDRGDTASVSLELRAFRVGELTLPPLVFAASIADGRLAVGWTDSLRVAVRSVVPADAEDILDIHGPVALANPRPWWPYAVGAVVLAVVLAMILARRRRRIEGTERSTAARPAHEMALSALARLEKREEARSGPWKIYYSELVDILRRYLARRFGVEASDRTTTETLETRTCSWAGAHL